MKIRDKVVVSPWKKGERYRKLRDAFASPLLVFDAQVLQDQYRQLASALPGVDFFYAIKSMPEIPVIESLFQLGCGFDIATNGEIERLRNLPVSPRKTIHTHPIKRDSDIRAALRYGCTTFVVDNIWELDKFKSFGHRVGLLLRIAFPNTNAVVDLSRKFGCRLHEAPMILQKARHLGLRVKGLSFHVGSQCREGERHKEAILACGKLMADQQAQFGRALYVLDIGGGFPVSYRDAVVDIDRFCRPIRQALNTLPPATRVWAEPGRYLSAPAVTSISSIVGKAQRGDGRWYFLDDGLYGSFSGQLYDHADYPLEVFSDEKARINSVFAGPTCDSIDVIGEGLTLPDLSIGDIVVGHQMGAYTAASSTDFNLIERARFISLVDAESTGSASIASVLNQ